MTIKVGDIVAYCYSGNHGCRRLRNMTVTRVMKTFIETNDGSRFSPHDFRQTLFSDGRKGMRTYHIDPQVSYWDGKDARDLAIRELNTAFENLTNASRERNWEKVKSCYQALSNLIGEQNAE